MVRLMQGLAARPEVITDALVDLRQAAATRPGAMDGLRRFGESRSPRCATIRCSRRMFDMRTSAAGAGEDDPDDLHLGRERYLRRAFAGRELEALLPDIKFHWVKTPATRSRPISPRSSPTIVDNLIQQKR